MEKKQTKQLLEEICVYNLAYDVDGKSLSLLMSKLNECFAKYHKDYDDIVVDVEFTDYVGPTKLCICGLVRCVEADTNDETDKK